MKLILRMFSNSTKSIVSGRWSINYDPEIMYRKVDLANTDNSLIIKNQDNSLIVRKQEKYTLEIIGCFSEYH